MEGRLGGREEEKGGEGERESCLLYKWVFTINGVTLYTCTCT